MLCCLGQQKPDNRIVIGTVDTVYSNILKEKRVIYVHVPKGDKDARYPVLYILDADDHFESAVAIDEQLSGVLPDMVIIGITNTNRERDLTPTHVQADRMVNAGEAATSGGGENFIAFMQQELIPYVDAHYPTTPYCTLSGHSLGGLMVLNAFFNHTALFNAYIAIDPSIWWDQGCWIVQNEKKLTQLNLNNKGLFIAVANNLPPGMDTLSVWKDTSLSTFFPRSVLGFIKTLRQTQPAGLNWSSKFYPNEWHGVVEFNAEYDALRYLFKFYRFDMGMLRRNPDLNADSLLTTHYEQMSKVLGYKVLPTEQNVNDLGYFYMGINKLNKAYDLLKRNTINYPQSGNVWDSLGDCYVAMGDKQKAIEAFKKSLSIQETADTRRKLNELVNQK